MSGARSLLRDRFAESHVDAARRGLQEAKSALDSGSPLQAIFHLRQCFRDLIAAEAYLEPPKETPA